MHKSFLKPLCTLLLACFTFWWLRAATIGLFVRGGPSKPNMILNNLRLLEGATERYMLQPGTSSTNEVSRAAVERYLPRGWPRSVAGEEYSLGSRTNPISVKLRKPLYHWASGTILYIGTNGNLVEVR